MRTRDAVGRYIEFCKASVVRGFNLRGLRLVLDCAHGATYHIAPLLFRELGANVHVIGDAPDGLNINAGVGSLHLDQLATHVLAQRADIGIAFDGDGDRVLMVDAQGKYVDGDDLLYLLARSWQRSRRLHGAVVGTVMTNYGLERAFAALHVPFQRVDVGDRHIHQALVDGDGLLGGETSGHLLCLDRASTGDGIVNALQVLEALQRDQLSLTAALAGLSKIPQKTVSIQLKVAAHDVLVARPVKQALEHAMQKVEGKGRVFLRASGTEPLIRVTVEAEDARLMEQTLDPLVTAVKAVAVN